MSALESASTWLRTARPAFSKCVKSEVFDVAIVGAGITGLTAAWLLKQAGKRVCVLERDRIGGGETGHTTAHLTMVTDGRFGELSKTFGRQEAASAWRAGALAIDFIEALVDHLKIDCDFARVPCYLHVGEQDPQAAEKALRDDLELLHDSGFQAEFEAETPLVHRPGLRFPDQALFHPLKYLAALAAAIDGDGSRIFENSEAGEFHDDPQEVAVGDVRIGYDHLILATHVPIMGNAGLVGATLFQTKLYPYSSYVVSGETEDVEGPHAAAYWDTDDPYRYLRLNRIDGRLRAVYGGEDHKTGQETDGEARYERLAAALKTLLPEIKIDSRWSGQVVETNDGLPYIGETAPHQYTATGYSGNGMTFGTCGGLMACDWALGRANPWVDLFSVDRKKLRGGTWDYLKENLDFPLYFLKDRLAGKRKDDPRTLAPGEGAVYRLDGRSVACSRSQEGELHQVSAVCTHMGCLVCWNDSEQTWDCPCHGSRYHGDGRVMGGPAETPLEEIAVNKETK